MLAINEDIRTNAVKAIARKIELDGPYSAEIKPDCTPLWHVITTAPSQESITLSHLVGRRFAVYFPYFERTQRIRGKERRYRRPLFPGHLFLFVWNVEEHWRRIRACPGVTKILTIGERPVVVPDVAIDRMQAIEFGTVSLGPVPKRSRKRKKQGLANDDNDIVAIRAWSALDDVEGLDDGGRISVLHKALGIS